MNFSDLTQHFTLIVTVACLVVGYIIKNTSLFKFIPNDDIPAILAVFGAVSNAIVCGVSFENIIYGALMGLASTGLHQAFKSFVEGKDNHISGEE